MIIAATIAILVAGGTYLVLQRGMLRLIMGIALLTHAVNLLILATGIGAWRTEPIMNRANAGEAADPLPQAFVLTAIVITLAVTIFMLALAVLGHDDGEPVTTPYDNCVLVMPSINRPLRAGVTVVRLGRLT